MIALTEGAEVDAGVALLATTAEPDETIAVELA